jgi:hypothetical protein
MPIPRSSYSLTPRTKLGVFIVALFAVIMSNMTAIIVTLATPGWKVFVRMPGAPSAPSDLNTQTIQIIDTNKLNKAGNETTYTNIFFCHST